MRECKWNQPRTLCGRIYTFSSCARGVKHRRCCNSYHCTTSLLQWVLIWIVVRQLTFSAVIVVIVLLLGYSYFAAAYYSESARELKRLDSALRSLLYSHFSESLSGLATIRAYGETKRFIEDDEYFVDLEDRALLLTCANQVR